MAEHSADSWRLDGDLPHCLASLSASTQDKPTTYGGQNQRELPAVSRLLWLDRRTRNAPSKGLSTGRSDIATGATTRCKQGFSQIVVEPNARLCRSMIRCRPQLRKTTIKL